MSLQSRCSLVLLAAAMSLNPRIVAVQAADQPEILTPPPAAVPDKASPSSCY